MAFLISPSVVSLPLWSSRRFFEDGHPSKAALSRLSIQKTLLRVTYFHDVCNSFEGRFPANHSCHNDLVSYFFVNEETNLSAKVRILETSN